MNEKRMRLWINGCVAVIAAAAVALTVYAVYRGAPSGGEDGLPAAVETAQPAPEAAETAAPAETETPAASPEQTPAPTLSPSPSPTPTPTPEPTEEPAITPPAVTGLPSSGSNIRLEPSNPVSNADLKEETN